MFISTKYLATREARNANAQMTTVAPTPANEPSIVTKDYSGIGKVWEKGDKHRLYLDPRKVAAVVGLDASYYHTGNVSSAKLDGEDISNAKATEMLRSWDGAFIDLVTGELYTNRLGSAVRLASRIMDAYKAI